MADGACFMVWLFYGVACPANVTACCWLPAPCVSHHPSLSSAHLEQPSGQFWQSCQMVSAASANDDACCGRGAPQTAFPATGCVDHSQETALEPLLAREETTLMRTSSLASGSSTGPDSESHTWTRFQPSIPSSPRAKAAVPWPLCLGLCIQALATEANNPPDCVDWVATPVLTGTPKTGKCEEPRLDLMGHGQTPFQCSQWSAGTSE